MHSMDGVAANIEKIGALFPNCVTETLKGGKIVRAIDFDMLRQELSDVVVEGPTERYQFTWPESHDGQIYEIPRSCCTAFYAVRLSCRILLLSHLPRNCIHD